MARSSSTDAVSIGSSSPVTDTEPAMATLTRALLTFRSVKQTCDGQHQTGPPVGTSEPRDRRGGVLDRVGHAAHEARGGPAVADPVVEDEGHLGDLADAELAVDDPRAVDDPPQAEDRDLRVVDDRRAAVDVEAAVVVQRERPGGQLLGRRAALTRPG